MNDRIQHLQTAIAPYREQIINHKVYRVIENIEELFANWTPRKNYHIIKCDPVKKKVAPHNLVY